MADVLAPIPMSVDAVGPSSDLPMAVDAPAEPEPAPEEIASETLYIQNLNEKIKINVLKASLRGLFKQYGKVLDVVAHANIRMRGQAFVSFETTDIASKAKKEVKNFPLYAKPMQISFAKSRSDAVVERLDGDNLDQFKKDRLELKRKRRWDNPHKRKARAKRAAEKTEGAAPAPVVRRPNVLMPDEYLPPNKILFLQNLPETVTKDALTSLFQQYPNLHEVRLIPTKKDIAFVEYADEASATTAKDALHNYKLDGEGKIKITFARK